MVRRIRVDYDAPIVLFGYANLFFHYGYERLCKAAADAGADGFLVVDLPYEESGELRPYLDANDLCQISLVAPPTPPQRLKKILKDARGFVYYIMVTGVTGARDSVAHGLEEHLEQLRAATNLPIAAGFGVSNGEQAARAAEHADAVVVGSALIKAARAGSLRELVSEIRASL
jgi:tryptophan synthase alpha chain